MFFDLNKFCLISGRRDSKTAVPIHDLVDHVSAYVVDILPPADALTGCDTKSRFGAKAAALKTAS